MTHKPRVLAVMARDAYDVLFDDTRRERLSSLAEIADVTHVASLDDDSIRDQLASVEVLITGWGAPTLDAKRLATLPKLRAVFHAAGSVRELVSDEFWTRNILITSAADANAIPVAEFTLASILFAGKRALAHLHTPASERHEWRGVLKDAKIGNLDRTVGIIGFSRTGRRIVELLRNFSGFTVLVADPFASRDDVTRAGATLVTLGEMLPAVDVLSIHAPSLPATRHMIGAEQLAALRDGATIINTARGALIDHDALLFECRTGRIDAILDVTEPEPLPAGSELLRLPNVAVTPHLAGSLGTETRRLADAALDELEAYGLGRPAQHPVDLSALRQSA